jgi:excinuclease ABC subunit B
MKRAMDETERRREYQIAHNLKHGITPLTIRKSVEDILEGAVTPGKKIGAKKGRSRKIAEDGTAYEVDMARMTTGELTKRLSVVEDSMFAAAKDLDFEKAARLRDELHELKEQIIKNS